MSGHKPTILQVIPALETGGAERTAIDVAAALVDHGFGSVVASEGGRLLDDLKRTGAHHVTMPLSSKNPVVMAANARNLAKLATKISADILHARSRAPA